MNRTGIWLSDENRRNRCPFADCERSTEIVAELHMRIDTKTVVDRGGKILRRCRR